ncbi:hypothetical protein FE257_002385 [Aspergillus nanangensis]|uniref:Uncharacterized protein n=1 Tax=Aspergillus nanangensis TaxID=2582783 RepID=A0AAD4CDZ9_ASPNN|nr:hypothetical protein FE257_002385 [Aspergillus nanangensis]
MRKRELRALKWPPESEEGIHAAVNVIRRWFSGRSARSSLGLESHEAYLATTETLMSP